MYAEWNKRYWLPDFASLMRLAHGLALVREGLAEIRSRRKMGPASDPALMIYRRERTSPSGVLYFWSVGDDTPENRRLAYGATGRPIYASAAAGY